MGIYTQDHPANELSQALRNEQEKRGLTRSELTSELKASNSILARVETKGYMMNDGTYQKFADFLDINIGEAVTMRHNQIEEEWLWDNTDNQHTQMCTYNNDIYFQTRIWYNEYIDKEVFINEREKVYHYTKST